MANFTNRNRVRTNTPECPRCGSFMISRMNKSNQSRFWGCSNFPVCAGTRDVDGNSAGVDSDNTREDEPKWNRRYE
jgi:ssDNA-binding Zn-finger/Zn-ribbon topoisomerase 1